MKSERRIARITNALRRTQPDLLVVLENIHDPYNVSAILRTCDAVGVRQVDLIYTQEKFPKIGRKSSASANKWVTRTNFKSVAACYESLKANGFTIAASVIDEERSIVSESSHRKSASLYEMDLCKKTALVFGNEHRGVSKEAAAAADTHFQIPMYGMVQSLNVSVACAITLYEALRQRTRSGNPEDGVIQNEEFKRMLDEWLKK